jgi:hypothetical protein
MTRQGVVTAYVRDLDSRVERRWGFGLGVERFAPTAHVTLGLSGDLWREPNSLEGGRRRDGWNTTLEADLHLSRRLGLSVMAGAKSNGYFPGRPTGDGFYLGGGGLVTF